MVDTSKLTVQCRHGERTACVVCVHIVRATDQVVGFVENSTAPDDLQAWCNQCEAFFLQEQDLTEDFRRFCDIQIVCDVCYAEYQDRHSTPDRRAIHSS